jgi:hypothetical protein
LYILVLTSCSSEHYERTVGIDRIDTTGIHFSYIHNGLNYSGSFSLDISKKDFYSTDSLRIKINRKHPEIVFFVDVIKRKWPIQEVDISIQSNISDFEIYGYHQIDQKPLFKGALNEYNNDSLIIDFSKKSLCNSENYVLVGVSIIINGSGQVSINKIYSDDEFEIKSIKRVVGEMPDFSPPIHKGDTVTVSYLIEIPVNK